jgi:hypothetical protein
MATRQVLKNTMTLTPLTPAETKQYSRFENGILSTGVEVTLTL